jgi:hypothetical protein
MPSRTVSTTEPVIHRPSQRSSGATASLRILAERAVLTPRDVGQALTAAWDTFRQATGDDAAGWDMTTASAEIRPEAQLARPRLGGV